MKMKLFLLLAATFLCIALLPAQGAAQACTGLQVSYTTSESRCMSTGTVSLTVSGGSGSYNYKVEGPVNTAFTSSNIISGLQAGTYNVVVKDIERDCSTTVENVVVAGSYQDPRFTLSRTNVSCARNDGTISVQDQQFGRSPFTYTLIAPSPAGVGTSNTSGQFSGLVAGEYAVQLRDSCGGIQVRRITIEDYSWSIDAATVTQLDCNTVNVLVRLKDNKGNVNTTSPADFTGFQFGLQNTDGTISWQSSNSFDYSLDGRRSLTVVVKDPCGNNKLTTWYVPESAKPAIDNINTASSTCSTFTATVTGQRNLTNPNYSLFDENNNLLGYNRSGAFSNLPAGTYCIDVADVCYDTVIRKCFTVAPPQLLLKTPVITARTCSTFTAGVAPSNFTASSYCIYNQNGIIGCNETGIFPNLPYGRYTITVTDACSGDVLDATVEEVKPIPIIKAVSVAGTCTNYKVVISGDNLEGAQYCLYDSQGNLIRCTTIAEFENLTPGDYCIKAIVCGETSEGWCFTAAGPTPVIDADVFISDKQCATFTATVTGQQYLTNPLFELVNKSNNTVVTNNNGVFVNIPYGSYFIRLTDGCNGAVIERHFEELQPQPPFSGTFDRTNSTCATFTAKVNGVKLTDVQYTLYNAANQLVETNTTGTFNNLSWGYYWVEVKDVCTGRTLKLERDFTLNYALNLTTKTNCTIGEGDVTATFSNGISPYNVYVYHPDGTLVQTRRVTSSTNTTFSLPQLPAGQQYTVTVTDACGRTDTKTIAPNVTVLTKSISVVSKCPSSIYQNGSGNIVVTASSNYKSVTPRIIKKDEQPVSITYSSSGNVYTFSDLAPGTYIVEYTIKDCSGKTYDTVTVHPYQFPSQGQSAIYQCDNNSFSLSADVSGGIGPYNYQIIGSEPALPSLVSAEQSSPIFNINNGTIYSLVRLRSIDACGNATLSDVSVLPLQNIAITATNDCFYRDAILSVDDIPNATYQWFKKTGISDSVLLTTNQTYNLPFMKPEDVGTYVARITINEGCQVRVARYTLDGDCGHTTLPNALQLKGNHTASGNVLSWQATDLAVVAYTVERKTAYDNSFVPLATVKASKGDNNFGYSYTDASAATGTTQYRIKWLTAGGKAGYSNAISLQGKGMAVNVFPNPVTSELQVAFAGATPATYRITLHNTAGQVVYETEMKEITSSLFRYRRDAQLQGGVYLLKVVNTSTGEAVHHKLLFK